MRSSGRLFGTILLLAGLVVGLGITAWLVQNTREDALTGSAAIFGAVLLLGLISLPMLAGGVILLRKGSDEAKEIAVVERQRKLLGVISTHGKVSIADAVLELGSTRDQVESDLHDLVSRGLFSGYVDVSTGTLYSVEASKLQGSKTCPNCGGELDLAGKGIIKCLYCGAEIFR